ncbi:hypothetical protein C6Y45_06360 [Alkalicoccus saliphilus]|uniref:Uncharacterized protein n=1 Tax=Alkalicoccus saliphilus TaxID=200989 RepID=A0A2T4U7R5_9BACI|nr:hypothetical protein C6Y45_06360 [Alkalicoccus saliphilus]
MPWGSSSAVFQPSGRGKDLPTSLHPTGAPAGRSGGKSIAFMEEKNSSNTFLREKTSFYISAEAAAGDSEAR